MSKSSRSGKRKQLGFVGGLLGNPGKGAFLAPAGAPVNTTPSDEPLLTEDDLDILTEDDQQILTE